MTVCMSTNQIRPRVLNKPALAPFHYFFANLFKRTGYFVSVFMDFIKLLVYVGCAIAQMNKVNNIESCESRTTKLQVCVLITNLVEAYYSRIDLSDIVALDWLEKHAMIVDIAYPYDENWDLWSLLR